jgi:hypothetical protein
MKGRSSNPEGRRVVSQRFRELFDGFAADYGGPERLSTFQKMLLAQACRLLKRGEKQRNINLQVRLTNAAARLLAAVQHGGAAPRTPPPRPPAKTLEEHLRQIESGAARRRRR